MSTPISTPLHPEGEDYKLPESGRKRRAEPKGTEKRAKQAAEDALQTASSATTSPEKRITRSITRGTRSQTAPAEKIERVRPSRKRGADEEMAVSSAKEKAPTLAANLLHLSPERLKALVETADSSIDADTVRMWVDSLDEGELTKRSDLDVFEALFTKVHQETALEKINAAKLRRLETAEKIFAELKQEAPSVQAIKALCQSGADLSFEREEVRSAILHASNRGLVEELKALVEENADIILHLGILYLAAMSGNNALFQTFAGMGVDINHVMKDRNEQTLLLFCSGIGNVEAVKTLIGLGANVSHTDAEGLSALH